MSKMNQDRTGTATRKPLEGGFVGKVISLHGCVSSFTQGKQCEEAGCNGCHLLSTVFTYIIFYPGPSPEVKLLSDDGASEH